MSEKVLTLPWGRFYLFFYFFNDINGHRKSCMETLNLHLWVNGRDGPSHMSSSLQVKNAFLCLDGKRAGIFFRCNQKENIYIYQVCDHSSRAMECFWFQLLFSIFELILVNFSISHQTGRQSLFFRVMKKRVRSSLLSQKNQVHRFPTGWQHKMLPLLACHCCLFLAGSTELAQDVGATFFVFCP